MANEPPGWADYYASTAARPPRQTTLAALADLKSSRSGDILRAIDLGAGGGRDTAPMLDAGLSVLAVDAALEAGDALRQRFPDAWKSGQLSFQHADFAQGNLILPRADLVNASFCLPMCPPAGFESLWTAIVAALNPGGLFAGHLYGPNDSWVHRGDGLTVHTAEQVQARFGSWSLVLFEEEESDSVTPRGQSKHWHVFHIVARKPG